MLYNLIDFYKAIFVILICVTNLAGTNMSSKLANQVKSSTITKENWQEKKKQLKAQFPHLSDTDLSFHEDKIEELINKLHTKIGKVLGKTKEGLHKYIESL